MSGPFKKVLRRMKRSFSSKDTSMTETPKIKRAMFRPGDISIDSESGAPYSATLVPVTVTPKTINDNMTKTPSTTNQTTPPSNGPPCSQTHKHAPAIWLTFCLTTVAVIFPREKAEAIGEAFIKLLGSERGDPRCDDNSENLLKLINNNSINFLNDGQITRLSDPEDQPDTAIDLALTLAHLQAISDFNVIDDSFGNLTAAFDKLWNGNAIKTLNTLGIEGKMLNWLAAFLTTRKIKVRLHDATSESCPISNIIFRDYEHPRQRN
ncbi:hypothetical protein DPMN_064777 [Dreissena polymorpha]|uniref:Uncharacterized protein n=1 Tax=Dreissena polymorpha TaxID=45954 RepID=A0A9D4CEF9_DREPO|nr:hypothetical protein DPMN_064777 [Dreissena polymorpha]